MASLALGVASPSTVTAWHRLENWLSSVPISPDIWRYADKSEINSLITVKWRSCNSEVIASTDERSRPQRNLLLPIKGLSHRTLLT